MYPAAYWHVYHYHALPGAYLSSYIVILIILLLLHPVTTLHATTSSIPASATITTIHNHVMLLRAAS